MNITDKDRLRFLEIPEDCVGGFTIWRDIDNKIHIRNITLDRDISVGKSIEEAIDKLILSSREKVNAA